MLDINVYEGPSLAAPFAAAVAEFANPHETLYPAQHVARAFQTLYLAQGGRQIGFAPDPIAYPDAVAIMALAFQEIGQPLGLKSSVLRLDDGRFRVAIGHFDSARGRDALRAALTIGNAIYAHLSGAGPDRKSLEPIIHHAYSLAHRTYIGTVSGALVKMARQFGIPVYYPSPGSNLLFYGQGAKAVHNTEAISSRDTAMHRTRPSATNW
jgi:hypothetical protein